MPCRLHSQQSVQRSTSSSIISTTTRKKTIDKIMDLVNKLVPNRVFPVQREAFTNVIKSRGNWYD